MKNKSLAKWFAFLILVSPQVKLDGTPSGLRPSKSTETYNHWFTGPIFTPNPTTVLVAHPAIEVVLITSKSYGFYDKNGKINTTPNIFSLGPYIDYQSSINEIIGIELIGSIVTNFCKKTQYTFLRDSIFRAGFQILEDQPDSLKPDLRILFQETFPTGNYQHLKPSKNRSDLTGQGSFLTGFHIAFQKLFHLYPSHYVNIRGDIGYLVPTKSKVNGLNYYISDFKVKGVVRPGSYFVAYLTAEYSFSKKWNLCCEFIYQKQQKSIFSGKIKNNFRDRTIKVLPNAQLIIAPEIEYTIHENLGIIFGGAASIFGNNTAAFCSLLVSALYIF